MQSRKESLPLLPLTLPQHTASAPSREIVDLHRFNWNIILRGVGKVRRCAGQEGVNARGERRSGLLVGLAAERKATVTSRANDFQEKALHRKKINCSIHQKYCENNLQNSIVVGW